MDRIPRISESEWQIMKVLWNKSPLTGNQVVEALAEATDWKPKTIKTLLNRLVKKDALGFKKIGRAYEYYPLVDEAQCIRSESRSFLQRVYGGALMPMLAAFLEHEQLSDDQIADLKRILDKKDGV